MGAFSIKATAGALVLSPFAFASKRSCLQAPTVALPATAKLLPTLAHTHT